MDENPSSFASGLQRNISRLEHRVPTTAVKIVKEPGSPWARFRENPKVLHKEAAEVVEIAFDEGGYVAGGCARWLRCQPQVTSLLRGSYVKAGGDIDLFFRDESGWRRFVERVFALAQGNKLKVEMSKGNLAANVRHGNGHHGYNSTPNMQAICCTVSEPDLMLRGFDFINAMAAFDRESTWVAEEWEIYEAAKTLGVAWWGSRSIAHRTAKYVSKYAYTALRDLSNGRMVEQLVAGYDAMSASRKATTSHVWRELVNRPGLLLTMEQKLTILSSATDGLDSKDVFEAAKEAKPGGRGHYESMIADLLARQERARTNVPKARQGYPIDRDLWQPSDDYDGDDPSFDAEEYCWAV